MGRILLVEPDRVLANTYASALEAAGHSVNWVTDAQSAIVAADSKPDLLITELQLIRHNGIELLYELRSYTDLLDLPVIIHSSVPEFEFRLHPQAKMFKIHAYLHKTSTPLSHFVKSVEGALLVRA